MVVVAVVAVAVLAVGAALAWRWVRGPDRLSRDQERFAVARSLTNHWADDLSVARRPVGERTGGQQQPVSEQRSQDPANTDDG